MNKQILSIFSSKLYRILAFLLLFVVLTNTVLSRFVKPDSDETLAINLQTIKKQKFDVVFMSNSYLFTAYDPLLLNSLTGLTSIHLGTSARRLCFEPFILKQILREQKPKLVVIDISSTTIVAPDSDHSWFFNNKAIANFNVSLDKVKLLKSIIPEDKNDIWLQSLSKTSRVLYNITTEEELKYYQTEKNLIIGKVFGYDTRVKQNLKKLKSSKKDFDKLYLKTPGNTVTKYNVIDETSIAKIQELLDIAEEHSGIQFLFINNVKLDASKENKSSISVIKNKVKPYKNAKVLELNTKETKKELDLKFTDFHDPGHVMQSGSIKVTSYFSDYLKQNYDFVNSKMFDNTPYVFKIKGSKDVLKIKDIKVLFADDYSTDIRVLIDSMPRDFKEVNTILSIFPKEKYKHLLEDKSKKNKWKSDNAYRKFKNYLQTKNGYVGKLNSWSKLKPEHIDRVEVKFSGGDITTETKILDLNKVNIFQVK
ncbi:hypothetical protein [Winogradskyella immobilis]|uniref:Uncharacterized protein n=1 Tax=Winogradskyella immobilis TaxID=2816852 RepID=A0ABS8EJV7_9FLAO|nr:hypothetical protein [Winogradskyella immobilis]MCC1483483.1 hypothetical protein [Winogradskyella immobilis]MCG0015577.1 hypothetical protein [Winogradskyella immobilis]